MTKNKLNPKVDAFVATAKNWQNEFEKLRSIVLGCGLREELKWGKPCYMFQGKNVLIIHGFKEYCALLFCKGALLKDANGILIQQTENVQAARQIRFTNVRDIVDKARILKAYIQEAIEVEKSGLEVKYKKTSEFKIPEEFHNKLHESPRLKAAFDGLTPGRQRGYLLYFSAPKQSKTREARVEKCVRQILNGKGLNDWNTGSDWESIAWAPFRDYHWAMDTLTIKVPASINRRLADRARRLNQKKSA
jgi:uncharacterized protein YdeI (YjbR/CyaY-like superfamily)